MKIKQDTNNKNNIQKSFVKKSYEDYKQKKFKKDKNIPEISTKK